MLSRSVARCSASADATRLTQRRASSARGSLCITSRARPLLARILRRKPSSSTGGTKPSLSGTSTARSVRRRSRPPRRSPPPRGRDAVRLGPTGEDLVEVAADVPASSRRTCFASLPSLPYAAARSWRLRASRPCRSTVRVGEARARPPRRRATRCRRRRRAASCGHAPAAGRRPGRGDCRQAQRPLRAPLCCVDAGDRSVFNSVVPPTMFVMSHWLFDPCDVLVGSGGRQPPRRS